MTKKMAHCLAMTALAASSAFTGSALAQESTLSFNAGAVSDYRYRGLSQSRLQPAVQAGVDYADKSGLYVGAWASTIKWIKDSNAKDGSVELDLYGGYKATVGDFTYDLGVLRYEYVGNTLGRVQNYANANTTEAYLALSYGPFTAKYSHSLTDTFGNVNSKNSHYLDLNATFTVAEGLTLTPHVGRQTIKGNSAASYNDYSLTLTKDLGKGLSASVAAVGTNASRSVYTYPAGKYLGKDGVVLGVKYTF